MTPFAPFFPYFSLAFSPLSTFMDSIVWGFILFKSISLVITPSMTMSGVSFLPEEGFNTTLPFMGIFSLGPFAVTVNSFPLRFPLIIIESATTFIDLMSEGEEKAVMDSLTGGFGGVG